VKHIEMKNIGSDDKNIRTDDKIFGTEDKILGQRQHDITKLIKEIKMEHHRFISFIFAVL
jgi:hypothetical protein